MQKTASKSSIKKKYKPDRKRIEFNNLVRRCVVRLERLEEDLNSVRYEATMNPQATMQDKDGLFKKLF